MFDDLSLLLNPDDELELEPFLSSSSSSSSSPKIAPSKTTKNTAINAIPIRGGLAIRDAVTYSFTPFGFPDVKLSNIHTQKVGKSLHISFPIEEAKDRILQILAINQIGAIATPYHWSNYNSLKTVLDVNPKLDIMHTEGGIFFQIDLGIK